MNRIKNTPLPTVGRKVMGWRALGLCLGCSGMLTIPALAAPQGGSGRPTPGQGTDSSAEQLDKPQDGKPSEDEFDLGKINPLAPPASDPKAEMIRLFQEVEGRMNRMGTLLFHASKGETSVLDELSTPGIDELLKKAPQEPGAGGGGGDLANLLKATNAQGNSALEGIDQILEIASQQGGGQCSSTMSGSSKGNSNSSKGKPQEQQESGKKKDQSASDPQEGKGGEKPSQAGEQPKDGEQGDTKPEPQKVGKPPERPTAETSDRDPKNDAWGNLPIHLRDIFRAEGGVEVPPQYRDWIDSYYRRLNRRGE